MRILVVSQYFPPENGAAQARVGELAAAWAAGRDDVTVLTGMPNYPSGIVPQRYRRRIRVNEEFLSCKVVRVWLYTTPNEGFVRRTLSHLSFMCSSVLIGIRSTGKADIVVVSSPPFFSIVAAWCIARIKGAKFVIDVRDLWPAILSDLGVLRNKHLLRVLENLELWLYGRASQVVVVTKSFEADLVERGVSTDKVKVIRNGVNTDEFHPTSDQLTGRIKLAVSEDKVLALYVGTIGLSHGLETLVEAGALLASRNEVAKIHICNCSGPSG